MKEFAGNTKRMKRIALLEPAASTTNIFSGIKIPRQGCVLLGTILNNSGYSADVHIEEMEPFDWSEIMKADVIGISIITPTAPRSYAIADECRKAGKTVILGGCHPTFLADEALDHGEFVVRGEGEDTILELVSAIENRSGFSLVKGLSYNVGGVKIHNEDRPVECNLDRFPIPDFGLVKGMARNGVVSVITRRGCPYNCSFCCVGAITGNTVREHSVERVLKEVETQMRWIGKRGVLFFADDIFNLKPERMKRILREMIDRKLTPMWVGQFRHEAARDREMLELMRRSNCARVFVGFESVNPRTLEQFGKQETVEDISNAIRAFHDAQIKVHGMFVLGADEDTEDTAAQTFRFARDNDLDSVQMQYLVPLPGSRDYETALAAPDSLLNVPWTHYDGHHVVMVPKKMSPVRLQTSVAGAMKGFYSLKGVAQRLLRGDLSEVAIRLFARRIINKSSREGRAYLKWLRNPQGLPPGPAVDARDVGKKIKHASHDYRRVRSLRKFRRWAMRSLRNSMSKLSHLPALSMRRRARKAACNVKPARFAYRRRRA